MREQRGKWRIASGEWRMANGEFAIPHSPLAIRNLPAEPNPEAAGAYLSRLLERLAAQLPVQTKPRPSPAVNAVPAVRVRFNRD